MRRLAAAAVTGLALALVPSAALAHGWWGSGTSGDGQKVTQPRTVEPFTKVRLEGSLDVVVKVGAPTAVAVTIDQNLQPLVETRVSGDTLVVSTTGSMSYHGVGRVEISTPALRGLAIEGSGDATVEGGQGDLTLAVSGSGDIAWRGTAARLGVEIDGSGDVRLDGTAEAATIQVSGSGDVRARGLTARSADVQVAGSGDVELTLAGGTLHAAVAGSGDVRWHGTAQVERASVSGSGEISHR